MTERQAYIRFSVIAVFLFTIIWAIIQGAWTENPSEYFSLIQMAKASLIATLFVVFGLYAVYFFDFLHIVEYKTYFKYGLFTFFGSMGVATLGWVIIYPFRLVTSIIFG